MTEKLQISRRMDEKGFTLLESLLVVGLSTMLMVGVVMGLLEGLDTLGNLTDSQAVEYGHQRVMEQFMTDAHSASMFNNGTVHDELGLVILRDSVNPMTLIMGYKGQDDREVWVRYNVRYGAFSGESYLMRTVLTSTGTDEGTTILTSGVSNLDFTYYDTDNNVTDLLSEVKSIQMTLSLTFGGSTTQRIYEVALRNTNLGVADVPGDFNEVESANFKK